MNDVTGLQGAFSTAMNHDDFQSFKIILGNESFFHVFRLLVYIAVL